MGWRRRATWIEEQMFVAECASAKEACDGGQQMQRKIIGVVALTMLLAFLVGLYEALPDQRGLIIFSTIIGLALKRR